MPPLWVRWLLVLLLTALPAAALADARVALVIGNGRYANTPQLVNPANDAEDVTRGLGALGFKVTLLRDAGKRAFDTALAQFARDARGADAALFYYAGHGMQYEGRNYVMPVDAVLRDEISLRYEMTSVDDVKAALEESKGVKILVLDSCRDNPLAEKFARSIVAKTRDLPRTQGLAPPERTNGMVIVYSTQADDVAHDGLGRNSPFSQAFLKELAVPGVEVGVLFRHVEEDVFASTDGRQSPELSISMAPEFYLNQGETDRTAWARLRESKSSGAAALRAFLARYPTSFYAPDARTRLELVERMAEKAPEVAVADVKPAIPASPLPVARGVGAAKPAPVEAKRVAVAEPPPHSPAAVVPSPDLQPEILTELRRMGCFVGERPAAAAYREGVAKYAHYARLGSSDLAPDQALINLLKQRPAGFCPLECPAGERAARGRCARKGCGRGELMTKSGICEPRRATVTPASRAQREAAAPTAPRRARAEGQSSGAGKRCFVFGGNRYCE